MALAKFLVFAIVVAALLPAGREMLDELVRELSSTKRQAVLKTGQPDRIGSRRNGTDGDAAGDKDFAMGSR